MTALDNAIRLHGLTKRQSVYAKGRCRARHIALSVHGRDQRDGSIWGTANDRAVLREPEPQPTEYSGLSTSYPHMKGGA